MFVPTGNSAADLVAVKFVGGVRTTAVIQCKTATWRPREKAWSVWVRGPEYQRSIPFDILICVCAEGIMLIPADQVIHRKSVRLKPGDPRWETL